MVLIWISVILMTVGRALWAWHDLFFWGKDWVKACVARIGWHNIKMGFAVAFWLSGFCAGFYGGRHYAGASWPYAWHLGRLFFALALVAWGAFEGMYNALQRDAEPFDWARYLWSAITGKAFRDMPMEFQKQLKTHNRIEFVLHHCFRLHWSEAVIVIICGVLVTIKL